jgi:uracil-DNA glycosylase family 4
MKRYLENLPEFKELVVEAQMCGKCPYTMLHRTFLGEHNGPLNARLLFIGEAPGVEILDGPTRPFSGSKSGANFDRFLSVAGIDRDKDVFITNAVLHTPVEITPQQALEAQSEGYHTYFQRQKSVKGRHASEDELLNCTGYLLRQIEIVNPEIVVTLGAVALKTLSYIGPHNFGVKKNVGQLLDWKCNSYGITTRKLVPLYHPSPTITPSRVSYEEQEKHYKQLASYLEERSLCGLQLSYCGEGHWCNECDRIFSEQKR